MIDPDHSYCGDQYTSDIGILNKEGYYRIVGRKKDMIIYGGVNVYPVMIEDYILTHPNIDQVAVVGVLDPEYGEVVAAVAEMNNGISEQEEVDYCYGKISSPIVSRYVKFDISLPLSGRGKAQKYKLREILAKMRKTNQLGKKLIPTKVKKKN